MLRTHIIRIGLVRSVAIATALAAALSLLFTYAVMAFKGAPFNDNALTISILSPLTIAPFLFWPLFSAFIKIHHLELEMRKLAMMDELTGIMNRRAFLSHAEHAINLAHRSGMNLALVYIDLDNFKTINDVYGHAKGDEVLKCFASVARGVVRKSDIIGRMGGEEFGMLIHGADKDAVPHLIAKLLTEIRNVRDVGVCFTASVGVAYLDADQPKALDQLLAEADKALYHAKSSGKDRMATYERGAFVQPQVAMPAISTSA